MTIKTFINTKNIEKRLRDEKIKEAYPQYHKGFANCLNVTLTALREGQREYNLIFTLYQQGELVHSFNDNWESTEKKKFNNFLELLNEFPSGQPLGDEEVMKLMKAVIDTQSMIERIGKLNGI